MKEKSRLARVGFRPHFKTHVSIEIAQLFSGSIEAITVSSLEMAEYFADAGWTDILLAFPANLRRISALDDLAGRIFLTLIIENLTAVEQLQSLMTQQFSLSIKVDTGYGRTGVSWRNAKEILGLAEAIDKGGNSTLKGTVSHDGHSYDCRSIAEIEKVHKSSLENLRAVKGLLAPAYPELEYSVGDTPTCSSMHDFSPATEIRPGNFVFYDLTQVQIGSCSEDEIAVAMACPIVAIHRERSELIIHGGKVHFAQDRVYHPNVGTEVYGLVVVDDGDTWGKSGKSYLKKLSQEHGTVHMAEEDLDKYQVGDLILILPVHSCTCANLMGEYLSLDGKVISRMR